MGVFKLDLMTLLVLFVVLSVILTMTSGNKDSKSVAPPTAVEKPLVQGMSDTNARVNEISAASMRGLSSSVTQAKYSSRTWN